MPAAGAPEVPPPALGEQVGGVSLRAPMTAGAEIRVHRAHTEDGAVAALKLAHGDSACLALAHEELGIGVMDESFGFSGKPRRSSVRSKI